MNTSKLEFPPYETGDPSNPGYKHQEATQFVEFCVELDNQDDRVKARLLGKDAGNLKPQIDPKLWNPEPVYDSRKAVARDVVEFQNVGPNDELVHWKKLLTGITERATKKLGHPPPFSVDELFEDPDFNGFGPWHNAWLLYEGRGPYEGAYAIAIRGTVFSDKPSALEDAIFQPVIAKAFLSAAVQFADTDIASLHSGFAHASFTLLLDARYGILKILADKAQPNKKQLYVVGHSQGAAMATIAHAFLHYAIRRDDLADNPIFGLKGHRYTLKSYGFAQPKPGNYAFSTDFSRITQRSDNAIVINNHIDPVPKVPLTLQASGDLDADFQGGSGSVKTLHFFSGIGSGLRGFISAVSEPFVRKSAEGYGYFYNYDALRPLGGENTGSSWNFVSAGRVLMVYGTPGDPSDLFLQHHATTYRMLIREQLGP